MGKGKYSKQFNMDQKAVNNHLKRFHYYWNQYNEILLKTRNGEFNTVLREGAELYSRIEMEMDKFENSSKDIKQIFIKKWTKKYGRYLPNPFKSLLDDLQDVTRSIAIRQIYLQREGIIPENEGDI